LANETIEIEQFEKLRQLLQAHTSGFGIIAREPGVRSSSSAQTQNSFQQVHRNEGHEPSCYQGYGIGLLPSLSTRRVKLSIADTARPARHPPHFCQLPGADEGPAVRRDCSNCWSTSGATG